MVSVMDILGDKYKICRFVFFLVLFFFLRMDSYCLGLHDKKTCVVKWSLFRTIVMHSCPVRYFRWLVMLLVQEPTAFGILGVGTFVFGGTRCLFFLSYFGNTRNWRPASQRHICVDAAPIALARRCDRPPPYWSELPFFCLKSTMMFTFLNRFPLVMSYSGVDDLRGVWKKSF